jgi:hypothetical protein
VARTAVVVIDMINAYDFPDAEKLIPSAELHWRSNRDELIEEALDSEHGRLVKPIAPGDALTMMERNMDADLTPVRD